MPNDSHQRAAEYHDSPHTPTVLPPRTTEKKITRPDTSIPNKRWNMPIKLPVVAGSPSEVVEVSGEAINVRGPATGVEQPMKRMNKMNSHLSALSSGASLGGTVFAL